MGHRDAVRAAVLWARYGIEFLRGLRHHLRQPDETLASLPRRLWEQARLLAARAMTADDYYLYRLHRRDLPWAAKLEFVGARHRLRWQLALNPREYRCFTDDKLIFKRFLVGVGIPTPRLLGVVGPHGRAETGEPLRSAAELGVWLAAGRAELVVKPVNGSRSAGVLVLGGRLPDAGGPRWARVPDGTPVGPAEIWAHLVARPHLPHFLLEERVRPHPELAEFSPEVVHTARIMTVLEGEARAIAATLRIGLGRIAVDSFGRDNIAAPVDVATGRLQPAVSKHERGVTRHRTHPVTGAAIEGRRLPDWERAVELVSRAHGSIPFNRCLGWDVAFGPDGPVVIGANDRFGINVLQAVHDRGLLGGPLGPFLERAGAIHLIGLPGWRR
jgi:hypothetical protein